MWWRMFRLGSGFWGVRRLRTSSNFLVGGFEGFGFRFPTRTRNSELGLEI